MTLTCSYIWELVVYRLGYSSKGRAGWSILKSGETSKRWWGLRKEERRNGNVQRQTLLSSQFNHLLNKHLPMWVPCNPLGVPSLRLHPASQSKGMGGLDRVLCPQASNPPPQWLLRCHHPFLGSKHKGPDTPNLCVKYKTVSLSMNKHKRECVEGKNIHRLCVFKTSHDYADLMAEWFWRENL